MVLTWFLVKHKEFNAERGRTKTRLGYFKAAF